MLRLPLSKRIDRRGKAICKLILIVVALLFIMIWTYIRTASKISIEQIVFDVCTMIISALISSRTPSVTAQMCRRYYPMPG